MMKHVAFRSLLLVLALPTFAGCATPQQLQSLQADEQRAETIYAAATQATAAAKSALATMPSQSPGYAQASKVVAASEKAEQTARLALDVASAAVQAAQKNDAADPALRQSLVTAISAIPSPWTPVLASLIPAAVPLAVSVLQSVRLGRAHQTVAQVTKELEQHKAALEALGGSGAAATAPSGATATVPDSQAKT
jgi:hypothetical protein